MQGSHSRSVVTVLGFVAATAVAITTWGQIPSPKDSELIGRVAALLRESKYEDAISLVRSEATKEPPHRDAAAALFVVGRRLFFAERHDDSLALLREITERFPDSPIASYAWCGIGQVYGTLGEEAKMIAALERGISAPRVETKLDILDASDTHNYACGVLGRHYLKTSQWEQALQTFSAWRPRSWCGTCLDGMRAHRENTIQFCLLQLGRADEMANRAWKNLATRGDTLQPLFLTRLYVEANQIWDLRALIEDSLKSVEQKVGPGPEAKSVDWLRLHTLEKRAALLGKALDLAESQDPQKRLEVFRTSSGEEHRRLQQSLRPIAAWLLIRDAKDSVPILRTAIQDGGETKEELLGLLAAIDTLAARRALVTLAVRGDVYQQQLVCGMIRARVKEPKSLIEEIAAKVPANRKHMTNWGTEPAPFEQQFYLTWPKPKPGSLPKSLPEDLWEKEIR